MQISFPIKNRFFYFLTGQVKSFMENEAKGTNIIGATSMEDMVSKLKSPRRVMLLVKGEYIIFFTLCEKYNFSFNINNINIML